MKAKMKADYEVLIIGGGPAGLSAAMTLGRIQRTALVVDDGRPRNAPSSHVNNLPGLDGIHPEEWRVRVRKDLEKYATIRFTRDRVESVERDGGGSGFMAKLTSGSSVRVKKVILAYGIRDRLPSVAGFAELWGKSIFHCPFCHGFEIRGSKIGHWMSSEMGFHPLGMIRLLSPDVVLFTNGKVEPTGEQREMLRRKNIELVEEKITRVHSEDGVLRSVELASGRRIEREYLFYSPEMPFELKSDLGDKLGCAKTPFGLYEVNEMSMTSVPGVFAAGDNMAMAQSVQLACSAGMKAGVGVIAQLILDAEHGLGAE